MKYLHDKIPDRHCGACTECCSALAVAELEKPLWEPCKHLCPKGCGIYERKPDECTKFECFWLRGFFGGDEHRPDRLGLIFAIVSPERLGLPKSAVQFLRSRNVEKVIISWESRPLAASTQKGRYILDLLQRSYNVYLFPYLENGHRIMRGPQFDEMLKESEKRLASRATSMLELRDMQEQVAIAQGS